MKRMRTETKVMILKSFNAPVDHTGHVEMPDGRG
jgi:hypothetical protein